MRFEDKSRILTEQSSELHRLGRFIIFHRFVGEFDAGLNHESSVLTRSRLRKSSWFWVEQRSSAAMSGLFSGGLYSLLKNSTAGGRKVAPREFFSLSFSSSQGLLSQFGSEPDTRTDPSGR